MAPRVYVAVGTKKGAFIMESDPARASWQVRGPYLPGQNVMHMAFDPRTGTLLAAAEDWWFGARVYRSKDNGHTWDEPQAGPRFPEETGLKLEKVWEVAPGRPNEPGVLYATVEPAALFKSVDGGDSWTWVDTLTKQDYWFPAAGGLCMHSITLDPTDVQRMWVSVSAGGMYMTEDGGETWATRNQGVRANFTPDQPVTYPEAGQCVHRAGLHPAKPARLYQQNHCGVYRSDVQGANWIEISEGLPSDWGLSMAIHAHDPETFYVCPAISGYQHWPEGGKFAVYRTRNAGSSWERLSAGLPQQDAFLNVHREGLAVDQQDPCGVYVGANTGQLWTSRDEGDTWNAAPAMFPSISSVTAYSL